MKAINYIDKVLLAKGFIKNDNKYEFYVPAAYRIIITHMKGFVKTELYTDEFTNVRTWPICENSNAEVKIIFDELGLESNKK